MVEFSREKRTEMLNQLREMMQEEPAAVVSDRPAAEEIPEDTPHYLNPKVLNDAAESGTVAYDAEETIVSAEPDESEFGAADSDDMDQDGVLAGAFRDVAAENNRKNDRADLFAGQTPEKMETVLNSGMAFIGGLMEMATGRKMKPLAGDEQMIRIDKSTGEVTMKFKLPGF